MTAAPAAPKPSAVRFVVTGAMLSNPGRVREQNEDLLAYMFGAESDPVPRRWLLTLVADGVGGHAAGEIASRIATDTVMNLYYEEDGAPDELLRRCLETANDAILARAASDPDCLGMGTTCTVLALYDDKACLAHIGDSRAYRLRNGILEQISEDHSLVAEMVRGGVMTSEEAAVSPRRNVISRALGIDRTIEPLVKQLKLAPGDRFLLCSDGLTDVVGEDAIRQAMVELSPAEACKAMVDAALTAGGPDNISVGIFAVAADSEPAETAV